MYGLSRYSLVLRQSWVLRMTNIPRHYCRGCASGPKSLNEWLMWPVKVRSRVEIPLKENNVFRNHSKLISTIIDSPEVIKK